MEDTVLSLIRSSKLARIADDLTSMLRQSIRIRTQPVEDESELAPGTSKFGGLPDLPVGMDWPTWNGQPLPLLAQFHLPDIAVYDRADELPHSGMFYIFFNEEALEDYPPVAESWRVLYFDGDRSMLRRAQISQPEQQVYPALAVEFSTRLTLPPFESPYLHRLGISYEAYHLDASIVQRNEADAYLDLRAQLDALYKITPPTHQFLGHPDQMQGDLLDECQRATAYEGDATDWSLLLQLDTDTQAAMMWGDVGTLYFYIPRQALAAHDFSRVHLIMQCM